MWVVDTCVILDVFEDDPQFGRASAKLLQKLLAGGLALSPVSMVELQRRRFPSLVSQAGDPRAVTKVARSG